MPDKRQILDIDQQEKNCKGPPEPARSFEAQELGRAIDDTAHLDGLELGTENNVYDMKGRNKRNLVPDEIVDFTAPSLLTVAIF
jgi:hypothetical protein